MNKNHAFVSWTINGFLHYSIMNKEDYQLALRPIKIIFESDSLIEVENFKNQYLNDTKGICER